MTDHSDVFLTGVIEGFYGRAWPHTTRLSAIDYLSALGFNTYLYAPKSDPFLRRHWASAWPEGQRRAIAALATRCEERGLGWGVGLSPFELYRHYGAAERQALKRKIEEFNALDMPILAVLFDDMPGDINDLALRQSEIMADIQVHSSARTIVMCPTYYSYDPVLPKYFGQMPVNYWQDLGENLGADIGVFWTGNKVCSESVACSDLADISQALKRSPVLWDNYPVNDGAERSSHLYCRPLHSRDKDLRQGLRGHLLNPMNQALMSLPALIGLADLYGDGEMARHQVESILGATLWRQVAADCEAFEIEGLQGMGLERCAALASQYDAIGGEAAGEVADWLRGEYTFDPACLTD